MKYLWTGLIFTGALIVPGTLFHDLSPWGIRPDLIMLWTIYLSLYSQPNIALTGAFVMGFLTDLYIGSAIGRYTLTLCIVALICIRLQKGWDRDRMPLVVMLVLAVTLTGQAAMALLGGLAGFGQPLAETAVIIGGVAVYNALLVLPTFAPAHRFLSGNLSEK